MQGTGVGLGEGLGVGEGLGFGVGLGDGLGVGEGLTDGLGDGITVGQGDGAITLGVSGIPHTPRGPRSPDGGHAVFFPQPAKITATNTAIVNFFILCHPFLF